MDIIPILLKEMAQEAAITRKMLACIPDDKFDYQPHAKSMTIKQLAGHIAELPGWVTMGLTTSGLDFATTPYSPPPVTDTKSVLVFFENHLAQATSLLEKATEAQLLEPWTLSHGEKVLQAYNRQEVIRMVMNQTTHHRAQLGVFLRLLNVPIPGSYGPSADELGK